jgi:hypothetical protein
MNWTCNGWSAVLRNPTASDALIVISGGSTMLLPMRNILVNGVVGPAPVAGVGRLGPAHPASAASPNPAASTRVHRVIECPPFVR